MGVLEPLRERKPPKETRGGPKPSTKSPRGKKGVWGEKRACERKKKGWFSTWCKKDMCSGAPKSTQARKQAFKKAQLRKKESCKEVRKGKQRRTV